MREMTAMVRRVAAYAPALTPMHGQDLRTGAAFTVAEWQRGVLLRDGCVVATLGPGRYRRWQRRLTLRLVDMRPWVVTIPTQEVPTADGATVKVTVAGYARVTDPVAYVTGAQVPEQSLYLAIQIALRAALATTSLDDLVANRGELGTRITAGLAGIDSLGVETDGLEVKDVMLSADLKRAQAEVLVARAQGLAALERARGETAALRSLANAARLAADNPALIQLRLIQTLGTTTGHTVVIGAPAPLTA